MEVHTRTGKQSDIEVSDRDQDDDNIRGSEVTRHGIVNLPLSLQFHLTN